MKKARKPPIGALPRHYTDRVRVIELRDAILRYAQEVHKIPVEWIEEYNELVKKLNK